MPNVVLVGAQWGDEGKGKVTDLIARDFDYVVRYQGGNNAGHTRPYCYPRRQKARFAPHSIRHYV